jgi:hypothetical protein
VAGTAFDFAGAGVGEALAVAWGFSLGVISSGEATGSAVGPVGVGTAFAFHGAGVGEVLAVASGFLAGVSSSGEAVGSAVAVVPCFPVELGDAVDPGGHVIQHSAPAADDRNVNRVTAMSTVSRSISLS